MRLSTSKRIFCATSCYQSSTLVNKDHRGGFSHLIWLKFSEYALQSQMNHNLTKKYHITLTGPLQVSQCVLGSTYMILSCHLIYCFLWWGYHIFGQNQVQTAFTTAYRSAILVESINCVILQCEGWPCPPLRININFMLNHPRDSALFLPKSKFKQI